MEIKKATIVKSDPQSGDDTEFISLIYNDGTAVEFPATAVDNRHYVEFKEWYKKQKKKPFKFDFK